MAEEHSDFERFRNYLLVLARMHMSRGLAAKIEPADIVQQTLMHAYQKQDPNQRSDAEVLSWLRLMLVHTIVSASRRLGRAKRDIAREQSLESQMERSSMNLRNWLVADQSTPSRKVTRAEDELRLAEAMMALTEPQREAILCRICQGWPLSQIAEQMGISAPAVIGLINRGTARLRALLTE